MFGLARTLAPPGYTFEPPAALYAAALTSRTPLSRLHGSGHSQSPAQRSVRAGAQKQIPISNIGLALDSATSTALRIRDDRREPRKQPAQHHKLFVRAAAGGVRASGPLSPRRESRNRPNCGRRSARLGKTPTLVFRAPACTQRWVGEWVYAAPRVGWTGRNGSLRLPVSLTACSLPGQPRMANLA